jgi:hypothetical protein
MKKSFCFVIFSLVLTLDLSILVNAQNIRNADYYPAINLEDTFGGSLCYGPNDRKTNNGDQYLNFQKVKKGIYGERPPCATAENNSSPTPSKNPATPPTTQPPAPNNQTTPPANNNVNSASPPISPQEATSQETPPSAYQRFTGTKPAN